MFNLLPTNYKFFGQFDKAADIVVRAADMFCESLVHDGDAAACAETLKQLEHDADEITHDTMNMLHKSFITPLERGDIRRLTFALDNIIDLTNDAARWLCLYEFKAMLPEARLLARVLADASRAIQKAVGDLPKLRVKNDIRSHCIEVNRLENEGDHVTHIAVANLFKSGLDPLAIIKWKEVLEYIETAIDRCEDCANVLEGIVQENT